MTSRIETLKRIGFPYGDFSVFLAKKGTRKFFIVKRSNIVVFKTSDRSKKSKKRAFDRAIELDEKSVRKKL